MATPVPPFANQYPPPDELKKHIVAVNDSMIALKNMFENQTAPLQARRMPFVEFWSLHGSTMSNTMNQLGILRFKLVSALVWYEQALKIEKAEMLPGFFASLGALQEASKCMICAIGPCKIIRCGCGNIGVCGEECLLSVREWHAPTCTWLADLPRSRNGTNPEK